MVAFKINHFHLRTPDPRNTAQWYVDNLGAKIVSDSGEDGGTVSLHLDLHGVPLTLTGFVGGFTNLEQKYGLEHVALNTDDLSGVLERLRASGTRFVEERQVQGRRVSYFEDPDGVIVSLRQM